MSLLGLFIPVCARARVRACVLLLLYDCIFFSAVDINEVVLTGVYRALYAWSRGWSGHRCDNVYVYSDTVNVEFVNYQFCSLGFWCCAGICL